MFCLIVYTLDIFYFPYWLVPLVQHLSWRRQQRHLFSFNLPVRGPSAAECRNIAIAPGKICGSKQEYKFLMSSSIFCCLVPLIVTNNSIQTFHMSTVFNYDIR